MAECFSFSYAVLARLGLETVLASYNVQSEESFVLHYKEPGSLELPETYPRNQFNDLDALDLVSRFVSSIPEHSALLPYGDIVLAGGKINLIYPFLKLGSVRDFMQKFKLPFLNEIELKAATFAIVDALQTLH